MSGRPSLRRLCGVAAAAAFLVVAVSGSAGAAPAGRGAAAPVAPLTSALVEGDTSWVVVPMGHLDDPLNTFWQILVWTPTSGRWVTVTPPGVADNGGLSVGQGPDGSLLAGFLPSQGLTFSPLSSTADAGHDWTAVYFPQGLISVPDALVGSADGVAVALGRAEGGSILSASPGLSSWHTILTLGQLATSTAGRRCDVTRLTAATVDAQGDAFVGAACGHRGVVGLFQVGAGQVAGPATAVPGSLRPDNLSVLRLVPLAGGFATLLAAQRGERTSLVVDEDSAGAFGPPSGPLVLPAGAKLLATGATGDGLFVLAQPSGGGSPLLAEANQTASGWEWAVLPAPPRGTVAAGFSDGRIDAMTVHNSTLSDYELVGTPGTWVRSQVVEVPIEYGSSD